MDDVLLTVERRLVSRREIQNLVIVPRGFSPHFYFYCEVFAREHQATLVLDRRVLDRRLRPPVRYFADRRSTDRRGPTPPSWRTGNFIWVPAFRSNSA